MATPEQVDVVIVGSGAAGSVFAAMLAEAGKSVRVLETGPALKLNDLYSSQIWSRRLHWATPHVEDKTNSIFFNLNAGRGFGGAAAHHMAVWPRYQIEDFHQHTLQGHGLDWPIGYDELRPYYDTVQRDVGMSGDAKAEIWRPPGDPYPLPPLQIFRQGEVLAEGFQKLDMHVAPLPAAILTRPYKGRPACVYDGWCGAGCPIGALASPLAVYLPRATAAGTTLTSDCHVTRVLTNQRGDRAIGVEYVDQSGKVHAQHAKAVALAAFTVENIRLLLNSATSQHRDGLANSSGLVGKYLMSHPAVNVYGLFKEDLQSYLGASGGQLFSQARLPKFRKTGGPSGGRHWEIALALKPNDLIGIMMSRADLFGEELVKFMKRANHSLATMTALSEDQPIKENRVELSEAKDQFGMRRARIMYKPSPEGAALANEAREEGIGIMKAAGADEAWDSPLGAQHIMGGTIMGANRSDSVTNAHCQTHDISNLFIGGPSLFPTSSHANSTFTLHALAMLAALYLNSEWNGIASAP